MRREDLVFVKPIPQIIKRPNVNFRDEVRNLGPKILQGSLLDDIKRRIYTISYCS